MSAGILNMLAERKAFFKQAQVADPTTYVKAMASSSAKLAQLINSGQSRQTTQMASILGASKRQASAQRQDALASERQFQLKNRFDAMRHFETITNQRQQQHQATMHTNQVVQEIRNVGRKLLDALNNLEGGAGAGVGGAGLLPSLFDMLGNGRGRRGRPGGRGRRPPRGRPYPPGSRHAPRPADRAGQAARDRAVRERAQRIAAIREQRARPTMGSRIPPVPGAPPPLPGAANAAARPGVAGWVRNAGNTVNAAGGSRLGAMVGKVGVVGAIAAGGYSVYNALRDPEKDAGQKAQAVAEVAGGTAGAMALGAAGGKLGAVIGTAILPGIGTGIGAAIGAAGGGLLGFLGGEKLVRGATDFLSNAVEKTGLGDHIGRGVAFMMAPFSAEARQALLNDFNHNILPQMKETFTSLGDKIVGWSGKIDGWMASLPQSMQNAIQSTTDVVLAPARLVARGLGAAANFAERVVPSAAPMIQQARGIGQQAMSMLPTTVSSSLGFVAAKYESGGRGVATVSTGRGDHGGVSYGKHQLASNNGSMARFLASPEGRAYAQQFTGLRAGTAEFNDRYRQVVGSDAAGMEAAQHAYIKRTHYDVAARNLMNATGMDANQRGRGVQEALMSTSIQHGGGTSIFTNALRGRDTSKMSDADIINAVQDYKAANVNSHFRSSSADVRASVARRIENERKDLLGIESTPTAAVATTAPSTAATANAATATRAATAAPAVSATPVATTTSAISTATPAFTPHVIARVGSPIRPADPSTPPEVRTVNVANLPTPPQEPRRQAANAAAPAPARAGGQISIDDIPAFIPDPSMLAVLLGRV